MKHTIVATSHSLIKSYFALVLELEQASIVVVIKLKTIKFITWDISSIYYVGSMYFDPDKFIAMIVSKLWLHIGIKIMLIAKSQSVLLLS